MTEKGPVDRMTNEETRADTVNEDPAAPSTSAPDASVDADPQSASAGAQGVATEVKPATPRSQGAATGEPPDPEVLSEVESVVAAWAQLTEAAEAIAGALGSGAVPSGQHVVAFSGLFPRLHAAARVVPAAENVRQALETYAAEGRAELLRQAWLRRLGALEAPAGSPEGLQSAVQETRRLVEMALQQPTPFEADLQSLYRLLELGGGSPQEAASLGGHLLSGLPDLRDLVLQAMLGLMGLPEEASTGTGGRLGVMTGQRTSLDGPATPASDDTATGEHALIGAAGASGGRDGNRDG